MKILSATDFLPKSEAAVERAGFLADSLVAELTVAHAVPSGASDRRTLEQRACRATLHLSARLRRTGNGNRGLNSLCNAVTLRAWC